MCVVPTDKPSVGITVFKLVVHRHECVLSESQEGGSLPREAGRDHALDQYELFLRSRIDVPASYQSPSNFVLKVGPAVRHELIEGRGGEEHGYDRFGSILEGGIPGSQQLLRNP
jgi:hypothetical protein